MLVLTVLLLSALSSASALETRCGDSDNWFYFNGNCYFWSDRTDGWFGAEHHCQQLGGHLVSVGDAAENRFLHAMAQCSSYFWTGMVKINVRQRGFAWWDGQTANFTEPLSVSTGSYEDCVYFHANGRWYNSYCQSLYNYVCLVTNIPVPNNLTVNVKHCPSGWLNLEGNCYFVSSEKTNYFNAQMSCETKGATVASVLSEREQTLVTMAVGCSTEAWIGLEKVRPCLNDSSQQTCWMWMDGTQVAYSAWASSPSTSREVECVTSSGRWRSTNCYNEYRYICKKK